MSEVKKEVSSSGSSTGAVQTIEEYVGDIVKYLNTLDYKSLGATYETLQKMMNSSKSKHELNYWKVLQCLGEVSTDAFVKVLIQNERASCKCHTYSNLFCLMQLFVLMQVNVAVIKRQLCYKGQLIPVFFKALRQREDPALVRQALIGMYRLLIVGKGDLVEIYMNNKFLMDCQQQVKCRYTSGLYSENALQAVAYCATLMFTMAIHGTPKTRRIIKNSPALRVLSEYSTKLRHQLERFKIDDHPDMYTIIDQSEFVKRVTTDEDRAQRLAGSWKPKQKLKEELYQCERNAEFLFCSSPACRKQCSDAERFRYCGACRISRYCSEMCQKDHWKKSHKTSCLQKPREELL